MLINAFISLPEASELKGSAILGPAALVERLEEVIGKLETVLARQTAENARLRSVEAAAAGALADLETLLEDSEAHDATQAQAGASG